MKKRLTYIDVINVIAIYFVLVIHSSWNSTNTALGIFDAIVRNICLIAVFLFIMNSGAMLLDYRDKYDTKTFFLKRFKRVGVPFLIWSVIYYVIGFYTKKPLPDVTYAITNFSIFNFIKLFLSQQIVGSFWFFYLIITLYLLTPLLSLAAKQHLNLLFYLVSLDFIFNFGFVYLNNNLFHLVFNAYALPMTGNGFIGFYIMGYLIKVNYFSNKWLRGLKVAGLLSLIAAMVIAFFKFKITAPVILNLNEYGGPLNYLYTIGFFIFVKEIVEKSKVMRKNKVSKTMAILSSLSLGIYVIHPFLLKLFMVMTKTEFNSWIDILCMPVFTYVGCGLIVFASKKIPYLREIFP